MCIIEKSANNKMWHSYTMEYNLSMKRNNVLITYDNMDKNRKHYSEMKKANHKRSPII